MSCCKLFSVRLSGYFFSPAWQTILSQCSFFSSISCFISILLRTACRWWRTPCTCSPVLGGKASQMALWRGSESDSVYPFKSARWLTNYACPLLFRKLHSSSRHRKTKVAEHDRRLVARLSSLSQVRRANLVLPRCSTLPKYFAPRARILSKDVEVAHNCSSLSSFSVAKNNACLPSAAT